MQEKEWRVELGHLNSNLRLSTCERSPHSKTPLGRGHHGPGELRCGRREKAGGRKRDTRTACCWLLLHLPVTLRQGGENSFSCSYCVRSQGEGRWPIRSPVISSEVIDINCQRSPIASNHQKIKSTDDDNDRRNDNYDGDLGNLDNNDDKNE